MNNKYSQCMISQPEVPGYDLTTWGKPIGQRLTEINTHYKVLLRPSLSPSLFWCQLSRSLTFHLLSITVETLISISIISMCVYIHLDSTLNLEWINHCSCSERWMNCQLEKQTFLVILDSTPCFITIYTCKWCILYSAFSKRHDAIPIFRLIW